MKRGVLILFVVWAMTAGSGVAQAGEKLWSVDIQGVDGTLYDQFNPPAVMDGLEEVYGYGNIWNKFDVPGHGLDPATDPSVQLLDSEGNLTAVTFTVFGRITGFSYGGAEPIIQDYLFVNAGLSDPFVTWSITGLEPGGPYELYAYGGVIRDVSLTVDIDGDGSLTDQTSAIVPAAGLLFGGIKADPTGTIIGRTDPGTVGEGNWGGFQLREARLASKPDPPDGAINVTTPLLQWTPGGSAASHDVYFGTNPTPGPDEYRGKQTWAVYWHQGGLTPLTTYYWRIDEIEQDGTIHTGNVWSFTSAPLAAYNPNPPDGARFVDVEANLSWTQGTTADSHDVYFGTDRTEVADGTGDTFKVNQKGLNYEPGTLQAGITYYWRIDEIESGGTKHTGDVWRFTTIPIIPITDPNLIAWWKLDEGIGTIVVDWSGYDHHGSVLGDPQWVAGYDGGALDLDGSGDFVDFGSPPDLPSGTSARSMCGWAKTDNIAAGYTWIAAYGLGATSQAMFIGQFNGDLVGGGYGGDDVSRDNFWEVDVWHHICLTYDGSIARLYADGVLMTSEAKSWDLVLSRAHIGRQVNDAPEFWDGIVDDVRIYNKTLTQAEIAQAMRGDPLLAWDPNPANFSTPDIEKASTLTWQPGDNAVQHDVYFGTDEDAVADADTSDTTGAYQGRQGATSYIPGALEWGQTYYWRIDEYNSDTTVSTGRVWSFTVAEYLIVDDFEDYNDYSPDRIFQAWLDGWGYTEPPPGREGNGTGSTVGYLSAPFAEQTIVHGGGQSMPFEWNNTAFPFYSETEREFTVAQDFTRRGVKALSLWFYGDPCNVPATLYVGLEDSAGARKDIPETNENLVLRNDWQEVNVDLSKFTPVNLMSVRKIYIGVGSRVSPMAGGTGNLFIDDIGLYRPRCVASLRKPANDLNDDCAVDYLDLEIVVNEWLTSGHLITPVAPTAAGLVAHYEFEGNANDSAGTNNGIPNGGPMYVPGKIGQAISLDGVDDYIDCGAGASLDITDAATLACWVKVAGFTRAWETIIAKGDDSYRMSRGPETGDSIHFGCNGPTGGNLDAATIVTDNTWRHVAVVYDGSDKIVYIDGVEDARAASTGQINASTYNLYIGENSQQTGRQLRGLVDDVRIYSRALAAAEVASLAGKTAPFSEPFDLNVDDAVDFLDVAILGDAWLEELSWPAP
ncbi:MAG: LamG domain-containing protein [Phycisphaerales bacterium]|nr:MAG: LamG domain-containing protein [Phycisphaerales bacterium]